jgi:hypothetical protein
MLYKKKTFRKVGIEEENALKLFLNIRLPGM